MLQKNSPKFSSIIRSNTSDEKVFEKNVDPLENIERSNIYSCKPLSSIPPERQLQYQYQAKHEPMAFDAPSPSEISDLYTFTRSPYIYNPKLNKWEIENSEELRRISKEIYIPDKSPPDDLYPLLINNNSSNKNFNYQLHEDIIKYNDLNIATIIFPLLSDSSKNADLFSLTETAYEEKDDDSLFNDFEKESSTQSSVDFNNNVPLLTDDCSSKNPLESEYRELVNWLKRIRPHIICCINITLEFFNLLLKEEWIKHSYEISDNEKGENTNEWSLFLASSIPINKFEIAKLPSTFRTNSNYFMIKMYLNISDSSHLNITTMKLSQGLDRKKQLQSIFKHIHNDEESIIIADSMEENGIIKYAPESYQDYWKLLDYNNDDISYNHSHSELPKQYANNNDNDNDNDNDVILDSPYLENNESNNANMIDIIRDNNDHDNLIDQSHNNNNKKENVNEYEIVDDDDDEEEEQYKNSVISAKQNEIKNNIDNNISKFSPNLYLSRSRGDSISSLSGLLDINDPKRNSILMKSKKFQVTNIELLDIDNYNTSLLTDHCNANCVYCVRI